MENLEALRASVRRTLERDFAAASRQRLKRKLLDALSERYSVRAAPDHGGAGICRHLAAGRKRDEDVRARASRTTAPPKRQRAPITARSPSAASGSAWCLRISVRKPISRLVMRRSRRRWSIGPGNFRAESGRSGNSTRRISGRWPSSGRRSSRRRPSIIFSPRQRSRSSTVSREELFADVEEGAQDCPRAESADRRAWRSAGGRAKASRLIWLRRGSRALEG